MTKLMPMIKIVVDQKVEGRNHIIISADDKINKQTNKLTEQINQQFGLLLQCSAMF